MSHRPLYKKSPHCGVKIFLMMVLGIALALAVYEKLTGFHAEEIVRNSVLKAKTFAAPVQEIVSERGIKAYLLEDKTNPIISMSFLFENGGWAHDRADRQGAAKMAAAMLGEGAGKSDSQAWKEVLESKAIGISFSAGKDDFSGSLLTTTENAPTAFEMLRLALSEPRFDQADTDRVRALMLEVLRRQKEHPADELGLLFEEELFKGHPYGRNPAGEAAAIRKLGRADLEDVVRGRLAKDNLIVGIAGDISAEAASKMLDEVFGSLPEKAKTAALGAPELAFSGTTAQISRQSGQNIVRFAAPGAARNDADFYPLFIANYIVGGSGLSSRLSKAIREDKGLTYGVYSYQTLDDAVPLLQAGFSTTADNYGEAAELFKQQWQLFGDKGVSAAEAEQAKNFLTASYNLRFASIGNIADILAAMQKYNLGRDFLQKRNGYVEAVTVEQVNAAAAKYFNKDRLQGMALGSFDTATKEK